MSVLYASDDAILLIGDNTFIDCNEATARMLGYATRDRVFADASIPSCRHPGSRTGEARSRRLMK